MSRYSASNVATFIEDVDGNWHDGVEAYINVRRVLEDANGVVLEVTLQGETWDAETNEVAALPEETFRVKVMRL